MYSGGGVYFNALMLFIVQGNKIINIFSEPTDEEGMFGGDWYEGGKKNFWETHNIVIMLSHKTSGFYDLRLKQRDGKWFRDFEWDIKKIDMTKWFMRLLELFCSASAFATPYQLNKKLNFEDQYKN